MRAFVDDLEYALKETLKLDLGETEFFVDVKQLDPGVIVDEGIAGAICDSLCLIAVYVPLYEKRSYCLREYDAMERLETVRREAHLALKKKGMIIPVLYRGQDKDLPDKITNRYVCADLRKFAPTAQSLLRNLCFLREIEKVAHHIVDLSTTLGDADLCFDCSKFALLPEANIKPWRELLLEPRFPR